MVLLIDPPARKPSEPSAGTARLAGALRAHGIRCHVADLSLRCTLEMLGSGPMADDTWGRRAVKNASRNIEALRSYPTYKDIQKYKRAVADLGRVLRLAAPDANVGLADFEMGGLSASNSADLMASASRPEANPFHPYFGPMLDDLMNEHEPRAVGISIGFLSQALSAFAMAGYIKSRWPDVKTAIGGGLVTSWGRGPGIRDGMFAPYIDHVIIGPGEAAMLKLCGIEAGGAAIHSPHYDKINGYLSPGGVLPYNASTGCQWSRCTFCPESAEAGGYRAVRTDTVMRELDALCREHKPALLHLLDSSLSPALLSGLAGAQGPGVPWYGFARVEKNLADPEFCVALRRSGCVMLKLGIESGSQRVLDAMDKGLRVEDASRALAALSAAGIATYVYLIFGAPEEDGQNDAGLTLDFTARHAEHITFLNLAIFNMPVGAASASSHATNAFSEGDLSLYTDFRHKGGFGRVEARRFIEGTFKKHRAVAPIIRRQPPLFTSNHAPFFLLAGFAGAT